ncbi:3-deoxy-manno-octulosonate cytidylyltransferase [Sedimentisphaera cyanobacteriorum]|uniref:3-deoxy-manno-octulosonate cytidylyltransferase n=1 Tax=Sedimentisphaera cyanobacteriorum TaxID=1940790 RepID=A0A1Q2HNH6_9BACT|nr:3-deoxy-manno-octulosonate cytidylyltransferase [Sedimentisphaera cyanobacteriorum]AQQ08804.1 3-deoxy-manno-octulosonate cytidylyltransferase [Sedimentisphaera cyanobacteriorum]
MNTVIIIPARYDSTRFKGKILASESGKYLVQHTYETAAKADSAEKIVIAVDSEMVQQACESFGAECVLTDPDLKSGTDRVAKAAEQIDCDIIVNVQADEPEIDPKNIDQLANLLKNNEQADMATLVTPVRDRSEVENPNAVKAVVAKNGYAIYFTRQPVPYSRKDGKPNVSLMKRHLGVYAYRKDFLMKITQMPRTPLEISESLEQLRALENGFRIIAEEIPEAHEGIDTEKQYMAFVERTLK